VAAYGYRALSNPNPPPPAGLGGSPSAGSQSQIGSPEGGWTVAGDGLSYVGYRAQEKLAFDFINAPNEAVGRTTDVSGSMSIADSRVTGLKLTANISKLTSNEEQRDMHLHRFLELETRPEARFVLTEPIELDAPALGQTTHVEAHGNLTILATSKDVVLPVDARWSGDTIEVATQLRINQSEYGMNVPQLVIFRVADELTIEGAVLFVRPCPDPCTARPSLPTPSSSPSPTATSEVPVSSGDLSEGRGRLAFTAVTQRGQQADAKIMLLDVPGGDIAPAVPPGTGNYDVQPAWSPDGKQLAVIRPSGEHDPELWVGPRSSGDLRVLATAPGLQSPDWSPDGRSLVAAQDQTGVHQVILISMGDGTTRTILEDDNAEATPRWSPDGEHLVFSRFPRNANDEDIYVVSVEGSGLRALTDDPAYEYAPDWSPDGQRIVFVRGGAIFVVSAEGGAASRLTAGLQDDAPVWSPDGRWIAFVRDRTIWVMNSDGTGQRRFETGFDVAVDPAWDPSEISP
jgi:polyisoprenoid-binding protein YceI